jgi:hypothetical protein
MRFITALPLLFASTLTFAAPPKADAFATVLELSGIRLLCEQSAPLLQRGLDAKQQAALGSAYSADALCTDLAERLTLKVDQAQLGRAQQLLDSPLAQRFTAAERAVGEKDAQGLAGYRVQLKERPPRQDRLELVKRLDTAAYTTELATLLRYEVGKTQALLALKARGDSLDEAQLSSRTHAQEEALRESSAKAVESFMLYAYRQIPSDQLAEYAALYEQPEVALLLKSSLEAFPQLFAERRSALR